MNFKRVMITAALALAMVVTIAPTPSAHALTTEELQQQIAQLQMQLNQLQAEGTVATGEPSACVGITFTRDLTRNSVGADVRCLQALLNQLNVQVSTVGPGAPGSETTFFGDATLSAVQRYQTLNSIFPAAGYVGPITRASLNANLGELRTVVVVVVDEEELCPNGMTLASNCTLAPDAEADEDQELCPNGNTLASNCTLAPDAEAVELCPNGMTVASNCTLAPGAQGSATVTLEGGAGSIIDADFVTGLNNEEVGEDESDVMVAGLVLEADDGSDIQIVAVTLDFDYADTGADDDLDEYASDVTLWFDGELVATVDASDFDNDNEYSRTVSLSGDTVIRAGETGELVVAVSGIANLDSANAGENWNVAFEGVRFRDAQGAVITDTSTGDITVGNDDTATDAGERQFTFETFATAANTELNISLDDDSVNDAHVINVHATDSTDDVDVLSFEIEIEGTSDVTIDELPVEFTTSGMNIDDAISAVYLYAGGELIGTENVSATDTDETITFDNLDYTIDAGATVAFLVKVDINDLDATSGAEVAEGDTIQAQITSVERALIDAEDESGEDLVTGDMTGTAVGDAHAIYDVAFNLAFVSATSEKTFESETSGTGDQGTFVIKYDITAFDGDIYIDNTCVEDNNGSEVSSATSYSITNDGSNTTSCVLTAAGSVTNADSANTFLVNEGTTRRFTLTVNATATADAFAAVSLEAIGWDDATGGDDNVFDFNLPGEFETDPIFLNLF